MAKMVGLSRKLRLPWLKYTVDLVATGMEESEIKDKINKYLVSRFIVRRYCVKQERY